MASAPVDRLTPDIIGVIFSYLDPPSLAVVSRVQRRWRRAVRDHTRAFIPHPRFLEPFLMKLDEHDLRPRPQPKPPQCLACDKFAATAQTFGLCSVCLKQKKAAGEDLNAILKAWEAKVKAHHEAQQKREHDEDDEKKKKEERGEVYKKYLASVIPTLPKAISCVLADSMNRMCQLPFPLSALQAWGERLTCLRLVSMFIQKGTVRTIAESFPSLIHLDLTYTRPIPGAGNILESSEFVALAAKLKHLIFLDLTSLAPVGDLDDIRWTHATNSILAADALNAIVDMTTLRHLSLAQCAFSQRPGFDIHFSKLVNLRTLDLRHARAELTDTTLKSIAALEHLRALDIRGPSGDRSTVNDEQQLTTILDGVPALEALYMSAAAKYNCIARILARHNLRDLYIAPAGNDPELEKKTARPGQRLTVRRTHSRHDDVRLAPYISLPCCVMHNGLIHLSFAPPTLRANERRMLVNSALGSFNAHMHVIQRNWQEALCKANTPASRLSIYAMVGANRHLLSVPEGETTTVANFKKVVCAITATDPAATRIVSGGRVMNPDNATLLSFGILDDDKQPLTMGKHVMIVAPPGAKPAAAPPKAAPSEAFKKVFFDSTLAEWRARLSPVDDFTDEEWTTVILPGAQRAFDKMLTQAPTL